MLLLAEEDVEDVDDQPSVIDVDDQPSVIEYSAACVSSNTVKCSQWVKGCASKAATVNLCHYGLGKRGAAALARSLVLHTHIHTLDLGDNGLGSEGVASILGALREPNAAPQLSTLSLRQNQAGEDGAEALGALLCATGSEAHGLTSIDFGCNGLGSRGASIVADGLAANSSLTSLSLEHNEIDEIEPLAKALGANSTLTHVSLEWNQLPPSAGKPLADALAHHPSLSAVNLGWNGLGDDGVKAIAGALEGRGSGGALRDLRVHHNRLAVEVAVPLSRSMGALHVLDVSGNALGAAGAAVLLLVQQELLQQQERLEGKMEAKSENATGDAPPKPPRILLKMEDVCVRPDTALAGLLMRAGSGETLPLDEMQASGVHTAAAPALAAAAPPAKPGRKGGKKGADGEKWKQNTDLRPEDNRPQRPKGKVK